MNIIYQQHSAKGKTLKLKRIINEKIFKENKNKENSIVFVKLFVRQENPSLVRVS